MPDPRTLTIVIAVLAPNSSALDWSRVDAAVEHTLQRPLHRSFSSSGDSAVYNTVYGDVLQQEREVAVVRPMGSVGAGTIELNGVYVTWGLVDARRVAAAWLATWRRSDPGRRAPVPTSPLTTPDRTRAGRDLRTGGPNRDRCALQNRHRLPLRHPSGGPPPLPPPPRGLR